jgi:hypothetical protein
VYRSSSVLLDAGIVYDHVVPEPLTLPVVTVEPSRHG